MNKKYIYIFTIIIILIVAGFAYYYYKNKTQKEAQEKTNSERLSTEIAINEQTTTNQEISTNEEIYRKEHPTETELSSYSSPIKDTASGRLNNIRITCSALNSTTVANGETFSFCGTLGPSTAEKGYKKATVLVDGKAIQALGGGNCQVSSTLYNAVLAVSGLDIIERVGHGKDVGYVPKDKDATVSYGSVDFKFKNISGNDIKLYFSSDDENVTVKIVKLTY